MSKSIINLIAQRDDSSMMVKSDDLANIVFDRVSGVIESYKFAWINYGLIVECLSSHEHGTITNFVNGRGRTRY